MTKYRCLLCGALMVLAVGLGVSLALNCRLQNKVCEVSFALELLRTNLLFASAFDAKKGVETFANVSDLQLEVQRRTLYAAYNVESKDFDDSHEMMGGGTISYAMLCNARNEYDEKWGLVVTNWFLGSARSESERRLMLDYGVTVEDLKYTRDDLVRAMHGWKSIRFGSGKFLRQELSFNQGVASYTNIELGCTMSLKLLKTNLWVHDGSVYVFAMSDVAGNEGYGGTDSQVETWFMRFKGGKMADSCRFKRGCDAFDGLRYHFEPKNNCIVITSTKTGDIAGELYLGLREYVDQNGNKSRTFEFSETMVTNRKVIR